jgi:hypothetical protein
LPPLVMSRVKALVPREMMLTEAWVAPTLMIANV